MERKSTLLHLALLFPFIDSRTELTALVRARRFIDEFTHYFLKQCLEST